MQVLSPSSWTVAYQWQHPGRLEAGGFMGGAGGFMGAGGAGGAELAVFKDSLRPAVRLSMYACPRDGLPCAMQVGLGPGQAQHVRLP